MRAVWMRARSDLRAGWRAWLGVVLVIGITGGTVMAAAAGARRTDSAYARFARTEHSADERVYDTPNPDSGRADFARVVALPQVTAVGRMRYFATTFDNTTVVASPDLSMHAVGLGLDRVKVTSGRAARPDRFDEVTVDFALAQRDHLKPGAPFPIDFLGPDQRTVVLRLAARVVGVVAVPGEFPPTNTRGYLADPWAYLTPAFYRTYAARIFGLDLVAVKVKPGQQRAFESAVPLDSQGKTVASEAASDQAAAVRHGFHLQALALWWLTALAALSGALVTGQLLARQTYVDASSDDVLRALGLTPSQRWGIGLVRVAGAAAAGTAIAVGTAWTLSPLTPLGTARLAEPHPGLALDATVLGWGSAGLVVLVIAFTAWPAWRATGSPAIGAAGVRPGGGSRPGIVGAAARLGLSPAATFGVGLALQPGEGRSAVPVRSGVLATTISLAALVAAVTFGASLHHLVRTPRLYGVGWDAEVLNNNGPPAVPDAIPIATRNRDVAGIALEDGAPVQVNGHDAGGQVFDVLHGSVDPVVLDGRLPASAEEVALGTRTMRAVRAHLGGTVYVRAWQADGPLRPLRVVGRAVMPPGVKTFGKNPQLGDGVLLNKPGLTALIPPGFNRPRPYTLAVRFASSANKALARSRLAGDLRAKDDNFVVVAPDTPQDVVDFGHVTNLPLLIAALLAMAAAATLAHVLASSVRRRARDLSVLKVIGFVPRQVRATVAWEATTLVVVALVAGVPIGLAVGRSVWGRFADSAGLVPQPVVPLTDLLIVVAGALLFANVAAAIPAWFAGRLSPIQTLKAE
jgi:hypothetical protein